MSDLEGFRAESGGVGGNRTLDQRIKSPPRIGVETARKRPISSWRARMNARLKPPKPARLLEVLGTHGRYTMEIVLVRAQRTLRYRVR